MQPCTAGSPAQSHELPPNRLHEAADSYQQQLGEQVLRHVALVRRTPALREGAGHEGGNGATSGLLNRRDCAENLAMTAKDISGRRRTSPSNSENWSCCSWDLRTHLGRSVPTLCQLWRRLPSLNRAWQSLARCWLWATPGVGSS